MQFDVDAKFKIGDTLYGVVGLTVPKIDLNGAFVKSQTEWVVIKGVVETIGVMISVGAEGISYTHVNYTLQRKPDKYGISHSGTDCVNNDWAFSTFDEAKRFANKEKKLAAKRWKESCEQSVAQ